MIEIIIEYALFLAKTVTIVISCLFLAGGIISLLFKGKAERKDQIQVKSLNDKYRKFATFMEQETLSKHQFKQRVKKEKAKRKKEIKQNKISPKSRKRLFVIDFIGDIRASAVDTLREEITAILTTAKANDEVLLRLESSGGMVHSYGLAASQLLRIKQKKIFLTIAVDKIAASGGYLMACVADCIIAAPFAVVGSVGVIAQLPNFNRLLKDHNIDFEQIVAGKYKRSLTLFGENTDQDREKLKQELEETHKLFKNFVVQSRRKINIEEIATGEHWYGSQALDLKLVDDLITSDDYLQSRSEESDLFEVNYIVKKSIMEKLPLAIQNSISKILPPRFQ